MAIDPAWIQAGSQVLGAALAPAPTSANAWQSLDASFDGSGWTVATGEARADGATITKSKDTESPSADLGGLLPMIALAFVALVWLRATKR